jgi:hypothetical protein
VQVLLREHEISALIASGLLHQKSRGDSAAVTEALRPVLRSHPRSHATQLRKTMVTIQ